MNARLTVTGFLAVLACTAALAGAALAEEGEGPLPDDTVTLPDEGGAPSDEGTWEELVDPMPVDDSVIFETGVVDGGEGEPVDNVEDGGDPVPYGPDDCIDCNVAPTVAFDGEGRGGADNERGGASVDTGSRSVARDSGGSGRPACGSQKPSDMRPCDD